MKSKKNTLTLILLSLLCLILIILSCIVGSGSISVGDSLKVLLSPIISQNLEEINPGVSYIIFNIRIPPTPQPPGTMDMKLMGGRDVMRRLWFKK